jgi:flagellar protein FliS
MSKEVSMSFAFARSRYRQAETLVQEAATDPYDIVFVTLRELNRSLGVLARTQQEARQDTE